MQDPIPPHHYVNIGPDGTFKPSGAVQTRPEDVDAILTNVREHAPGKVVIHFHGGLVKEAKGLELAGRIIPTYESAGAYPITVVWETGLFETVKGNLTTVNQTKLFNKLVNYGIRHAAKWLGASVGARGPGQPMSLAEVEAARSSGAEIERMDAQARGPGGVQTEADVDEVQPDIELEVQADLEGDPEVEAIFAGDEVEGERGIISAVAATKVVVKVVTRTLKRFTSKHDHGVIATVVEEVLREVYLADAGEWIWSGMKTAAADMWKPNNGPVDQSSHAGSHLLAGLAALQAERPELKVDLIGHSAGSIAIAHLLETAAERHPDFRVRNLILLAPAAGLEVFEQGILGHQDRFEAFRMFTMEDALECKDHLVPGVYPRSLLYLISGILDGEADSPVVGLRRHTAGNAPYDGAPYAQVSRFLAAPENRLVLSRTRDDAGPGLRTWSARHGDFDDDEHTLASLTAIVSR